MAGKKKPVLSIESLTVDFDLGKTCHAVRDTSVRIEPGEMVALVGESGCGKTMTALSAIGLQPRNAKIPQGRGAVEPVPGPEHRHDFPGAHDGPKPPDEGGPANRGERPHPRGLQRGGQEKGFGSHAPGGPARCGAPVQRVSPPALRRHAPACDDCHGPGEPAGAAHRRRAHHRVGRDHPGPDYGAHPGHEPEDGHRRAADFPRPGRHPPDVQPGVHHVRRPRGGKRRNPRGAGPSPAPLYQGADCLHPLAGKAGPAAFLHPRHRAGPGGPQRAGHMALCVNAKEELGL